MSTRIQAIPDLIQQPFLTEALAATCRRALPCLCHADIEDAVQETLLKAHSLVLNQKLPTVIPNPEGYLHRMVVHAGLVILRRRTSRERALMDYAPVTRRLTIRRTATEDVAVIDLLTAVPMLPAISRETVECYLRCVSYRDAAEQLGISAGALSDRMAEAKRLLRLWLRE